MNLAILDRLGGRDRLDLHGHGGLMVSTALPRGPRVNYCLQIRFYSREAGFRLRSQSAPA